MRTFLVVLALLGAAGATLATPVQACVFKSANGSIIRFVVDANPVIINRETGALSGHVFIDGKKCSYDDVTFTCGDHKTSYTAGADGTETLKWRGVEYTSTDHCSAGPE